MDDATTWAIALLVRRIEDAADHITGTYSGAQRLAVHGRELLAELVPATPAVRDYPAAADDDWQGLADMAYEAAWLAWWRGGDEQEVCAAAELATRELGGQELAA